MSENVLDFRPQPVSKLLAEMKEVVEDMLDLSFAAILLDDREIVEDVGELNALLDNRRYNALASASLGVRDREDAMEMLSVYDMIEFMDDIASGAMEILKASGKGLRHFVEKALAEMGYSISRYKIKESQAISVDEFEDRYPEVDIIAIWKKGMLITKNLDDIALEPGDTVLVAGTMEAVSLFTGEKMSPVKAGKLDTIIRDLIDITYSLPAIAFAYMIDPDRALINAMRNLSTVIGTVEEKVVDSLLSGSPTISRKQFLGLLHILRGAAIIKNAIDQLFLGVRKGVEIHEVISMVLSETENVTIFVEFSEDMERGVLHTLRDFRRVGIDVIAATVDGKWRRIVPPDYQFKLGDLLILYGHRKRLSKFIGKPIGEEE